MSPNDVLVRVSNRMVSVNDIVVCHQLAGIETKLSRFKLDTHNMSSIDTNDEVIQSVIQYLSWT